MVFRDIAPDGTVRLSGALPAQGLQGDPGNPGTPGTNGTNGEKWWFQATGAPNPATGVIGDVILITDVSDYYEKTGAAVWTFRGNLKGPQGLQGIQGEQGPPGTVGAHDHDDRYYTETEADSRFINRYESGGIVQAMKRIRDAVLYSEPVSNGTGWLVIHTNTPFLDTMYQIKISGYNYTSNYNIIDLDVGFYAYSAGPSALEHGVVSRGNLAFATGDVAIGRRNSDSTVVVILRSPGPSSFWNYPKIAVDVLAGHGLPSEAQLTGWSMARVSSLSAYTVMVNPLVSTSGGDTGWIQPSLGSGWTSYDTSVYGPVAYKKLNGVVYIRGLATQANANSGHGTVFSLPVGYRPLRTRLRTGLSSYGHMRYDIRQDGAVNFPDGSANPANAYFSLDASFPADQ